MPTFDTPGSVALEVRLPAGRVMVDGWDEPRTDVELVAHGRRGEDALEQVEVSSRQESDGHVVVSVEQRDRFRFGPIAIGWGGDVEIRITCPQGADLEFDGASADLSAAGRYGNVSARTASGDLRLGDVSGRLQVKTASGGVSARDVRTDASVVTVSGGVEVEGVEAPLTVRTVSGDVELGRVKAPVTVQTTSGGVTLRGVEGGEVRIQTVSGDARVGVVEGVAVWMDAASVSGELRSDLGRVDEPPEGSEAEVVPLHAKTVSGDVSFVRAGVRAGA